MRAWLFVLAVLATFQPIVQVASTGEIELLSHNTATSKRYFTEDERTISGMTVSPASSSERPDPATLLQIEKNLLSLFGFKNRPIVDRSQVVIPEAMRQLYADIMGHELESLNSQKLPLHTKLANTIRSFTHEESKIDARFLHHHRFRLHFNVSSIPLDEKLKGAELTLSRQAIDSNVNNVTDNEQQHQIHVYDIIRPGIKGKREPIFLLIDSKTVRINSTGTVTLDVLPAVMRWLRTPHDNYGILLHISTTGNRTNNNTQKPKHKHIRLRRSIDDTTEKWAQNQPILFTYTDDGRHKQRTIRDASGRARRAPSRRAHRRKDGREICQRRPLYVDFSDVGWSDWIVAPPGYEAYYCHGECQFPIADHLNSTNHAVVQTLVNSINPSLAPRACCVPTQLTSISMLYLDDQNKVVLKNYQDMTVVGCGCR